MPWCANCKSEYDDHVTRCKACDVDLVEDIEAVVFYEKLATVYEKDLKGALEYLSYSGIEDVQTKPHEDESVEEVVEYEEAVEHENLEEVNEVLFDILVKDTDFKKALKHIKVYFFNLEVENQEAEAGEDQIEEETKGYATDNLKDAFKIKEMRSSAASFIGIGGLLFAFGLLNLMGVLQIIDSLYLYGVLFIGAAFFVIGFATLKKIPTYEAEVHVREDKVLEMIDWYESQQDLSLFFQNKKIAVDELDEGALYYAAMDVIKIDLSSHFPQNEEVLVNEAAEEIFIKIK